MKTRFNHGLKNLIIATIGAATITNIAQANTLQQCRSVTDPAQRLACYDALPVAASAPTPSVSAASATATTSATNAGGAVKSTAGATSTTVTETAPSPLAAAPKPAPVGQFGLEDRIAKATESSISSEIMGKFEGWEPNSRIKLANGQVWQVSDDSSRSVYLKSQKITIRRGALGSFYLEFDGSNYSPRVKRIQ